MSIARIRTPEDPPDAAWNYEGHGYVGFDRFRDVYGNSFPDRQCEQCTTLDRTPASLDKDIKNAIFGGPLWPDEDAEDGEWLPKDDSGAGGEMLEYDSEADCVVESSDISQSDDESVDGEDTDNNIRSALRELHAPPQPRHLPHGTLRNGYMYTREWEGPRYLGDLLPKQACGSALAVEHMGWLWEAFEAERYPNSPDWPMSWDPCNPPGLVVPDLPYDLETEEQENALWAQIIEEDPEMECFGNAVKTSNSSRREAILAPYRARAEHLLQEWRTFRDGVAEWICRLPLGGKHIGHDLDWARLWRLSNPDTTPIPGMRNRARIWKDCERILDYNVRLREQGVMDAKSEVVGEVLSENRQQWWSHATAGRHDSDHKGFLRQMWHSD
ncbi:unnamed protein product [Alternaria sp. RS040]